MPECLFYRLEIAHNTRLILIKISPNRISHLLNLPSQLLDLLAVITAHLLDQFNKCSHILLRILNVYLHKGPLQIDLIDQPLIQILHLFRNLILHLIELFLHGIEFIGACRHLRYLLIMVLPALLEPR